MYKALRLTATLQESKEDLLSRWGWSSGRREGKKEGREEERERERFFQLLFEVREVDRAVP